MAVGGAKVEDLLILLEHPNLSCALRLTCSMYDAGTAQGHWTFGGGGACPSERAVIVVLMRSSQKTVVHVDQCARTSPKSNGMTNYKLVWGRMQCHDEVSSNVSTSVYTQIGGHIHATENSPPSLQPRLNLSAYGCIDESDIFRPSHSVAPKYIQPGAMYL